MHLLKTEARTSQNRETLCVRNAADRSESSPAAQAAYHDGVELFMDRHVLCFELVALCRQDLVHLVEHAVQLEEFVLVSCVNLVSARFRQLLLVRDLKGRALRRRLHIQII